MQGIAPTAELDMVLDVFGQKLVTIFTQISFCFPLTDTSSHNDILTILTQGLDRLAKNFPWVAGQVVCEGATEDSTGIFKIKPLEKTPRMFVKDLRDDPSMLSMEDLRGTGFPMNALDENVVAPRKTSSGRPGETIAEVFQLQVNLIRGGLILTFLGQHQAMDGVGLGHMIHQFSKACRNEEFTQEELRIGNHAPQNIVPLFGDSWKPGPELTYNIRSLSGTGGNQSVPARPNGTWSHFSLSSSSLKALKSVAMQTLPPGFEYVSTDDALSAFIWQSVLCARISRFEPATKALFARAVDLRRYLSISPTHPGFVQSMTYHDPTFQQILESPLGEIAANLRAAVDPERSELVYNSRSLGTLISRTPNKASISFIAGFDMSKDVMLSSWANQNSYELDFGLGLGVPEAVRRPSFDSFQGLVYLLPKSQDGEIGVAVCLSHDDMERLKADEHFTRYVRHF